MIDFFRSDSQSQSYAIKAQRKKTLHTPLRHGFYSGFSKTSAWGMVLSLCCLIGQASPSGSAWADCQSSYKQAIDLLDVTTKKASKNEHPDADAFSSQFKTMVGNLQSQKCLPELMSLIQHIQSEQQKLPSSTLPAEAKNNRTPITD